MKFVDDVMLNLYKGQNMTGVFLDITKAFDTIDHNILLNKLKHSGVGNTTTALFTDYLRNRKQAVLCNGNFSNIKTLTTGVPQGSTLGLLLVLIYVNDLPNILVNVQSLMFADDTVVYHLDSVYKWCQKNYITLNITYGTGQKNPSLGNPPSP